MTLGNQTNKLSSLVRVHSFFIYFKLKIIIKYAIDWSHRQNENNYWRKSRVFRSNKTNSNLRCSFDAFVVYINLVFLNNNLKTRSNEDFAIKKRLDYSLALHLFSQNTRIKAYFRFFFYYLTKKCNQTKIIYTYIFFIHKK
jgi:hypothetical protein